MQSAFLHRLYPRVRTRVTTPFLLMILLVAAAGVLIVTRLVAGNIQERLANQLADSAQAAANTIVDIENGHLAALRAMVFTEGVAEAVVAGDVALLQRLLVGVIVNEDLDDVVVFDKSGKVVYRALGSTSVDPASIDVRAWNSTQNILGGRVDPLGDKFIELQTIDERATFYFAAPVITLNNQIVGGVLVGMWSDNFVQQVSGQTLSSVTLHNSQGEVIDSSFRDAALSQLTLPYNEFEQIRSSVGVESPMSREMTIENVPYQFLYAPFQLRSSPVGLIAVALPVDFVQDRIGTSRNIFFVLFSVVMLGMALLGLVITRSIVHPVFRIVETTRAIQKGDLSRRVALKTPDELGELGQSIDHMTSQLVDQNRAITTLYNDQLAETARREGVLQSIGDGVVVLDEAGKPYFFNGTASSILQRLDDHRLLTHPHEFYEPQALSFDNQYFSVLSTPVVLETGERIGHVLVFRNITEIIESEKLKDEIILQLSHELRTPLSAAKGYADLLMMFSGQKLDQRERVFGENVVDQLDVLAGLIDQVVEVNEMLVNSVQIDTERFDLVQSIREVVDEARPKIDRAALSVTLTFSSDEVSIEGDRLRIEQVIRNILKNAWSYTLPGGQIDVTLERDGIDHVLITVSDTGVGIAQDEIHRVFEKMYRGSAADAGATDTRGMGLGLYISQQIIERHGGTISIESEQNVGTVVTIRLPEHPLV
jgi:two-component system, OmpR family, phosphate regulon sensor histidine kinase PhoR